MRVFRDLTIAMPETQDARYVTCIEARLHDGWMRDRDAETNLERVSGHGFYFFRCDARSDRPAAVLSLTRQDKDTLYVPNVVPHESGRLTYDEYNRVVVEFHHEYAGPVALDMGFSALLTSDDQTLEDWISTDSAQKLRSFSLNANKSTGSGHPCDQRRWYDFVISVHRNNDSLCASTLERWLIEEEGWGEHQAGRLAVEYEEELGLLSYYEGR
jgi:hypothetical protein